MVRFRSSIMLAQSLSYRLVFGVVGYSAGDGFSDPLSYANGPYFTKFIGIQVRRYQI